MPRWFHLIARGRVAAPALTLAAAIAVASILAGVGLAAPAGALGDRPLSLSDAGPDVAELQRRLAEAGVYQGPVTGYFGPLTREAVVAFQRRTGLPTVGVAGPQTVKALLQPRTHTVAEGENLWTIARRYRVSVDALRAANALASPDLLRPGDVLKLPAGAVGAAAAAPGPEAPRGAPASPASTPSAAPPAGGSGSTATTSVPRPEAPPTPEAARIIVYRPAREPARPAVARANGETPAGTPEKLLALTFNDGPNPATTAKILELLRGHDARATFFLIGERAAARPELVAAIAAAGHEIGNHGLAHQPLAGRSRSDQAADLRAASDAIERAGGGRPRWFRPPGGLFDERTLEAGAGEGLRLALWTNIGPQDVPPPVVLRRAKSAARDGAILLLKESEASVEVLEQLLPALKQEGFRFVTLSELEARE